jgi:hypothetical protein
LAASRPTTRNYVIPFPWTDQTSPELDNVCLHDPQVLFAEDCLQGKNMEALDILFADDVVSVEAVAMPGAQQEH